MQAVIDLAEKALVPDPLIRLGIRRMCATRLREEDAGSPEARAAAFERFVEKVRRSPVAVATGAANEQHYEVPPALFQAMLGPRLKYSCCLWDEGTGDLEAAEEAMLALTCERARLRDARRILELGCGWGSLTMWMARHYPGASITAVSNSASQREFIEARCAERGLANVTVVTADMNDFQPRGTFDRVVSVEMFEHMRGYGELMRRIASWLDPGGLLFVHIFCHREFAYFYEPSGPQDWMAREFFTGGTMPSEHLLARFQDDLELVEQHRVSGIHYTRTLEAWLDRLDDAREEALAILGADADPKAARRRLQRWRIFLMACSELFAWGGGGEWFVSHYLFRRPG